MSFVILPQPVSVFALCVECNEPFVTSQQTDGVETWLTCSICDECQVAISEWWESNSYDLYADR